MKNTLFFLGLVLLFSACDTTDKFRAPIEDLSSKWETATTAVTEFAGTVDGEEAKAQQMLQQIVAPEGSADTSVAEIKSRFQEQVGQLTSLKETVMGFVSQWQEKTAELNTLKEGLTGGTLSGDTMVQVEGLQEMVATANANLDEWKSKFNDLQAGYTETFEEYSEMKGEATVVE